MPKKRRVAVAIDLSYPVKHHYEVFAGIQRYARERGNWDYVVDPYVQLTRHHQGRANYDGVIARASRELVQQAAKARIPFVNLWVGSPVKNVPGVFPDLSAAGRMAAEHLLSRGYRRFAFQGCWRSGTQQALAGFKAALRAHKYPLSTLLASANCTDTAAGWHKYMLRLKEGIATWKPPVGVMVIMDCFCHHLSLACRSSGLRIPEDVGLISTGNEPLICNAFEPSLSSIDLGFDRVGYKAAALLDRLMAGKRAPETPILIEPAELIARRSTDSYIVDNPQVAAALRFIGEHSHEGIRVDHVAAHVHTSVRSLERYFSAAVGRTMTEEIMRMRLERAARLLLESDASIKELARTCGFNSASYLHQVFLRGYGITPREYRRRHRLGGIHRGKRNG